MTSLLITGANLINADRTEKHVFTSAFDAGNVHKLIAGKQNAFRWLRLK